MTSNEYLKFLATTNITWFSLFSLTAIIQNTASNWQFISYFRTITLIIALIVSIFSLYYPYKKGINPYANRNSDNMKQSILYWVKDEREVQIALKVYANVFVETVYFFFLFWIIFCSTSILYWNKTTIINFTICYALVYFWWSNIKMVLDWRRYSKQ